MDARAEAIHRVAGVVADGPEAAVAEIELLLFGQAQRAGADAAEVTKEVEESTKDAPSADDLLKTDPKQWKGHDAGAEGEKGCESDGGKE